jgi:alpha-N-acetylglucosaminidase
MRLDTTRSSLRNIPMHRNNIRSLEEKSAAVRIDRFSENGRKRIRHRLYDLLIGPVTHLCYDAALNYFHDQASVLDVGIGNGFMIPHHHELIKVKGLNITGIDISSSTLEQCARRIRTYGLENQIQLQRSAIEDFQPRPFRKYDFVFFSMTFMLMQDQPAVLDKVRRMLIPGGEIVFFQTMYSKNHRFLNFVKPRLKYLTGIDFGPASYEENFFELLKDRRIQVKEDRMLQKTLFKGEFRIIVAAPDRLPTAESRRAQRSS